MKIERVETYPLLYEVKEPYGDANGFKKYRACYLIRVITQSGVDGWGEIIDWLPTVHKGLHERIIPYLLGKHATDRLQLIKVIKKWHQRAAAGISMALTEIVAKKAGLSICQLWGGPVHNKLPVYASFQSYWATSDWEEKSISFVQQQVAAGFCQVKVKVGAKTLTEDQQHISHLQDALQNTVKMALDANQSYDFATAKRWERLFSKWDNLLWFEEPLPLTQTEEYKLLRSGLSIAVAGGENFKSGTDFLPLLRLGAIDIMQPDTMHEDGIEGYRATLQLARHFGVRVSPHAFDGLLSRLYAAFAQACLPAWSKMKAESIEPLEWDVMDNPFTELLPFAPKAGEIDIPNDVGIGMELNQEIIRKYRWDGSTYV